jgi:hypothetical protein
MDAELRRIAYRLTWETDHLEFYDTQYDAEIVPFSGSDSIFSLGMSDLSFLPRTISFEADARILTVNDYPFTNVSWPIFSKNAISILTSLSNFEHKEIAVIMVDDTFGILDDRKRFDSDGIPHPDAQNQNFSALQVLREFDFFDFEHSQYDSKGSYGQGIARFVTEYVLNCPPTGYPLLFRLAASPAELFISGEARFAFKEAGIRGVAYHPLNMKEYTLEVDHPVPVPETRKRYQTTLVSSSS